MAEARINIKKTKRMIMPTDISEPLLDQETTKRIQPKAINENESGSSVFTKIADNSLALWWDTSPLRNSAVGKAAEAIEKNLKTEVAFKNKSSKTEHRFSFKVLAMQALAKVEYKGWVNAAVNYDARAAKTEAEVTEKISQKQDFVVSHQFSNVENKSQVAWRWNW